MLYAIHIDNNGDGYADISYEFRFRTQVLDENTFLYNTGPIESINSPNWNRRQFYDVSVVVRAVRTVAYPGHRPGLPAVQHRAAVHAGLPALAGEAVHDIGSGITVFAGQRAEGFYVDLGSIFDLGDLRPFQELHTTFGLPIKLTAASGVNATNDLNVHSITIRVPISAVTKKRPPDHRRVDLGEPPVGHGLGWRQRPERVQRAVAAGVAAGQPAGQ